MAAGGGVLLRRCNRGDLDDVKAIEDASFPDPYSRLEFQWCLLTAQEGFVVACERSKVVGYVIALVEHPKKGHIVSMAVLPGRRREGIGGALMKAAIDHFVRSGAREAHLEVRPSNAAARALYSKFLFAETDEVKRSYYSDGEDALVMARRLP